MASTYVFDGSGMTVPFAQALESGDMASIRRAPKADFHRHAFFGTYLENVERWLGRTLERPVFPLAGLKEMEDYASRVLAPHISSRTAFEYTSEAALNDAREDGIRRLEMSFDIRTAGHFDDGVAEFASAIQDLEKRHERTVDLRPELGIARENIGDSRLEERAREGIESGLFQSIDLYGNERACTLEAVTPLYRLAQSAGLKLKAHAGEFGGAERVRESVEVLGLHEVQHGIAAAESVDVMGWLSRNRIRLNVCPSGNVLLGAVVSLAAHPIRVLVDNGVEVTVNTDDPMIFGQSVSREYLNLYRAGVFTAGELNAIRVASIADD